MTQTPNQKLKLIIARIREIAQEDEYSPQSIGIISCCDLAEKELKEITETSTLNDKVVTVST